MRILILAPLKRKIVPEITASRSRVVYELIQGLIKKGHKITVLGTQDSFIPGADIVPVTPKGFVDMPPFENPFYGETSYLVQLAKKTELLAKDFDIIHNHTYPEFINLMIDDRIKTPMVTTLHAQGTPEFDEVLNLFPGAYLISISKAHRRLFKKTNIFKIVYNGVDTDFYSFEEKKGDYLLWLGRLSKAKDLQGRFMDPKGIGWAISLAKATGSKLLLSGSVEDMKFYESEVKPHLNDKIKWIGPVSSEQMLSKLQVKELMQKARAFLMTINWYEPFGLVMAEAMACGTPVIGFDRGSVNELIEDNKTGFVVNPEKGLEGLKESLSKLPNIKPDDCRQRVLDNFSLKSMVDNYEKTYLEVINLYRQKNQANL
ncbi:glycosyltransferase family 4 protein [Candidatus Roizmanbacteria bacterium]|jgi:glycosyltransferase involved in cell wall biosynthesis|nr:glycosyltransferase family 4 protein [Candidatus Roizmanbacteria bacterium]